MYNLPKKHINGRVFFGTPTLELLTPEKYFDGINTLGPLFDMPEFINSTPGFYINYLKDEDNPNGGLRLNYYTTDAKITIETIEKFTNDNADKILLYRREPADINLSPKDYNDGGNDDELRFRNFLNINTRIVLDIIKDFGVIQLQLLVHCYRHYWLGAKVLPEIVFEPIFERHSNYFRKLKKSSLDKEYWRDLVFLHRDKNYGLHFLVNMMTFPDPGYGKFWDKDWLPR